MSTSRLFQPIQLGRMTLHHRVVQAALTRNRADEGTRVMGDEIVKHYALRATVPGTLIIAEATFITPKNAGLNNWRSTPGAWSVEQIAGWKKVVYPLYKLASMLVFIDVILDRRRRACARLFHISPIMGHRS